MGKKENTSADKTALKCSFNKMALNQITLPQENYDKRDEKLLHSKQLKSNYFGYTMDLAG